MDTNESFNEITYRDDLHNYLINRKGEIYSKHRHCVLKGTMSGYGYLTYTLYTDKGKAVRVFAHIAVAQQYIPNPDAKRKTYVNHKDENKQNCHVDNLEWVTPKENTNHGTGMKRSADSRKKPIREYDIDGHYIRTWASVKDVSRFYANLWDIGTSKMASTENAIYGCLKGNSASACGRIWRYLSDTTRRDIYVDNKIKRRQKHSPSKLKLDYTGVVPDEYLYHEPTNKEIKEYFLNHERLTEHEKSLLRKIWG